ncbi:MAG: chromosome segregation protein SMC [Planctomycetota bacterium]
MRLAKLTLNGFKSFADRTGFAFEDAVTGVVGPNGCGKSNIVDAVKWVLGERSSKSLRGKEMADVIFAGSAGRDPKGMAAVTLTFENPVIDAEAEMAELSLDGEAEDPVNEAEGGAPTAITVARKKRSLPIDADEVEVERRLYRDGTSQYLVNGRRARLKDIRDLFLDTGIGADAYSIIEQGKVDRMLLASPQERRTIFEEAAGIARYRQRKVESQRRLDRAMQNLALVREQLESTERRLRIVRGQAAKARKFQELDAEYRALRSVLAFDQHAQLIEQLEGLTSRMASLEGERERVRTAVEEAESAKQAAELRRQELLEARRADERELDAARHAAERADQERALTERSLADERRRTETDRKRLQELESRRAALATDAEDKAAHVERLAGEVKASEAALETATDARAQAARVLAEKKSALGEQRAAVARLENERAGLLAAAAAEARRLEAFDEQREKLEARASSLSEELHQTAAERSVATTEADQARAGAQRIEVDLGDCTTQAASVSESRSALAERVSELEQRAVRVESRQATLREMVESGVGLGESVKTVIERRDSDDQAFAGVIAPLADVIETDPEYVGAVEAALGEALRSVVIESVSQMPPAPALNDLPGRVTFLPARGLDGNPTANTLALPGDRLMPLRSVVRSAAMGASLELDGLLDRLLGSTYLVADLDTAMMLRAGPFASTPGIRFVTSDGAVFERDGRVTAGPAGGEEEGVGLLARRTELAKLERELSTIRAVLAQERASLETTNAEVAQLTQRQGELRSAAADTQRRLAGAEHRRDRLEADEARLERELESAQRELEGAASRIEAASAERETAIQTAEGLAESLTSARGIIEQLDREADDARASQEAAAERATAARVETGRLSEQAEAAQRELGSLRLESDRVERESESVTTHLRDAEHRAAAAEGAIEASREASAEARELQTQIQSRLDDRTAGITDAEQAVRATAEHLGGVRAAADRVERDWNALEISRREVEVKRETLEDRTLESIEVDLARDGWEYRVLIASGGIETPDHVETEQVARDYKAEIDRLGNVNHDALEEETRLEGKNEQLAAEVADLDHAKESLTDLIGKLDIASRERFGEAFERIRDEFGRNDGMFRRLFGGGRAEVRLMPLVKEIDGEKVQTDEVDLLESGIEVIAKPPGKEPRSISQLSGGEKSLTAVALLMAIFKSKPSCFCVLDEVDAALDEANVERFCGVVRAFTSFSHFIVITHHKRTMHACDRLYGVTMQERGVSKRVSVKFEQVGAGGAIKQDAPAVPEAPEIEPEASPREKPTGKLRAALAQMRDAEQERAPLAGS